MKNLSILLLALILVNSACNNEERIELFNGENLENWTIVLPDSVDKNSVFYIDEGVLHVGGIPNGYIRTNESYENYKLHLEWRWLEEPKNSGILLHTTGEDRIWPNCIEAQLMNGNAGDFVLIGKGVGITVKDSAYRVESEENRFVIIPKFEESSENPAGEWNSYDISVSPESIKLEVNGVLQNECRAPSKRSGRICIQSEGGPMEFREVFILQ